MPILYLLVLVLVLSWALNQFGQKSNTIPYSRLVELFRQGFLCLCVDVPEDRVAVCLVS